jgi:hypothetical protein
MNNVRHIRYILPEVLTEIITEQVARAQPPPLANEIKIIQLCSDNDGYNAHGQQCLVEINGARSIRLLSSLPSELQNQRQEWQNQTTK